MSAITKFAELLNKYADGATEAAGNNVTNQLAAAMKGGVAPTSPSIAGMEPAARGELVRKEVAPLNRATGSQDPWVNKLPALSAGSQSAAAQRRPAVVASAK